MSEQISTTSVTPSGSSSGASSLFKNFGMYAHIAEISLILGSAAYFYTKNSKLEARILELEKKIAQLESITKIEIQPNKEERQRELNDLASFLYNKIMEDISQAKDKKKTKKEKISEITVQTETLDEDALQEYEIENELKKEM
jgi:hypothetical protein